MRERWALPGTVALVAACGSFGSSSDVGTGIADSSASIDAAADEAPPDGGVPDAQSGDGTSGPTDHDRVVFVTSNEFYPDDLRGIPGATRICNDTAQATGNTRVKGRSFLPWLSDTSTSPAKSFVKGTKPYITPSGKTIANDWTTFASAAHLARIDEVENGQVLANVWLPWTGTNADGTQRSAHCAGWTARGTQVDGVVGNVTTTDARWSFHGTEPCDRKHRIYCVEQ